MEKWSKIKPKVNLVIDTLMFLVLMSVAGLGFMMKFVLLPGYKINEVYGTNTELYFRGLDRHQWGAIHLYLALFMVFLLILHIIFHRDTIICIFKRMVPGRSARWIISLFIGFLGIFLVLAPALVKPEVTEHQRNHNRNRVPGGNDTPIEAVELHLHNQVDIDGTMTLTEVAERYKVSVEKLTEAINVPVNYTDERLRRLKKRYGFEMEDLRVFVISLIQKGD